MKSKLISVNMMTGQYVDMLHSHTIVTFEDNSETLRPNIATNDYTVFQPMYSLKGPSDRLMVFEGSDVLTKWDKLVGQADTSLLGPMMTYAYRALLGGWRVATIRIAPPEATYANFYAALDIKAALDDSGEIKNKTLYVEYDTIGDYYHMSYVKETLPNKDTVIPIVHPALRVGFDQFVIEDCRNDTDIDMFLGETVFRTDIQAGNELTKEDIIHIPIFGLVYTGRGSYGNVFNAQFSVNSTPLNELYPYFSCKVVDTEMKSTDHEFNFTLFNIQNQFKVNQGFFDQATEACKVVFTTTNMVETFRPYQIDKSKANKTTKAVNAMTEKYKNMILEKIKTEFPGFDELASASDWYMIEDAINYVNSIFEKPVGPDAKPRIETPFSYVNPFDTTYLETFENTAIDYSPLPTSLQFQGGYTGELDKILEEDGFSWDIELPIPTEEEHVGVVDYIGVKPGAINIGKTAKVTVQFHKEEPPKTKFFVDYLKKCYTGEITNRIFDQAVLPDSLIMGEDYPFELQEVVANLVQYKYTIQNNDKTRPDCTYWRTPDKSVTTIDEAIEWARAFSTSENLRMVPMIGSWMFEDETTGGTGRFSATYEYFGSDSILLNHLTSLTSDSFSSGDYSVIYKGKPNTQKLIPENKEQREELAKLDIMYFTLNPDQRFCLANDTAWKPGKNSKIKYFVSSIQYGKIIRECSLVMRRHQIIEPTAEKLNDIKNELVEASRFPAQHFGNRIKYTVQISDHVNEAGQNIPLAKVEVTGNDYSNRNRILFTAENSANQTN